MCQAYQRRKSLQSNMQQKLIADYVSGSTSFHAELKNYEINYRRNILNKLLISFAVLISWCGNVPKCSAGHEC